jgi:membrane protease YdiL (CAAX protease family)
VFVERILEHFKIDRYFDVVVGSELDGTRVNKDEVVQEALELLFQGAPVLREQVYMVGDRKFDVEGAKAHGIECVAVSYGYGSIEELKEAGADYIVCSVEELKKLLLLDVEEAEYIREKNTTIAQKIWSLVYPLLMFLCVRVLVVNLFLMIFPNITGNVSTLIAAVSYAVAALSIGGNAKLLIAKTSEDVRLCHLRHMPISRYILLDLAVVGAVLGLNLLFALTGFIDISASYQEVAESQFAASLIVGLLCYGVITPVAEELLFRGIIHNGLRRFMDWRSAVLMSAAIFGIYHGNIVQASYGFLMGWLLAYGYEYFGKFKVPVLIHIVANLLAYCFPFRAILMKAVPAWIVCIISLLVAVVCLLVLWQSKKNEYKDALNYE